VAGSIIATLAAVIAFFLTGGKVEIGVKTVGMMVL
jgi:hypothetical protein